MKAESAPHGEPLIRVERLCKLYGARKEEAVRLLRAGADKEAVYKACGVSVALWEVDCVIRRGEIFAVIGYSGSGKSTFVRCLNMLNRPSSGRILYKDADITALDKHELLHYRRHAISMVFQHFALLNHRNVLRNVAYGLEVRGTPRKIRERRAMEMIELVGLKGLEKQSIRALSGGMRQRVGIARALANDPEVLLMDEPFSALDPIVRGDMQAELLAVQRGLGKTVVLITHDVNEAFRLADSVAVMRDGRVVRTGAPRELAAEPGDEYVDKLIASADRALRFKSDCT